MKHILNNLTEQEKNAIREQHTGGMKVSTDKFNQLLESKLGDVKPILSEQTKRVDVVKPKGQTIPLIQIKVAEQMCDLTMMRKLPTGASFYGKRRGTEVFFEVLFTCGSNKVIFAEVPFPKTTLELKKSLISPQAYELLKKAAGCDAYVKNQDTSDDDVTLAEQDIQSQTGNVTTGQTDGGKAELIEVLMNHLNNMSKDPKFNATSVAQVVYNDAAHFMNKTDLFQDQNKYGKPFPSKVPFAPQGLSEQTKSFDPKTFNPGTTLIKPQKPEPEIVKVPGDMKTPKGKTIPVIKIKLGDSQLIDLTIMDDTGYRGSSGAIFYGKFRNEKWWYQLHFYCNQDTVYHNFAGKDIGLHDGKISPEAVNLLNKAAGCNAYVKNQDTSSDDVTLAEQYAGERFKDSTMVMTDKGDWLGNIGKSALKPNGREFLLSYSCGDRGLPQGNTQVAKNIAQSFVNAIKGIDVSGKGQDVILKNLQSMANLSLEDWNQVLVEYCKLPKDWDSENLYVDLKDEVGFSFSKGNTNDYEGMLPNQASNKIESYCKNYAKNMTYTDKYNSSDSGYKQPSGMESKFCKKFYEYK